MKVEFADLIFYNTKPGTVDCSCHVWVSNDVQVIYHGWWNMVYRDGDDVAVCLIEDRHGSLRKGTTALIGRMMLTAAAERTGIDAPMEWIQI